MKVERLTYGLAIVLVMGTFLFITLLQDRNAVTPSTNADVAAQDSADNKIIKGKRLVFGDEFDGTGLDNLKWSTCYDWRRPTETGCTNHGNFEQQWYTEDQVKVANGSLIMTAEKRPIDVAVRNQAKSFQFQSGMINSGSGSTAGSPRWAGSYGYYEARMKFDKGQGIWPAFWLLPVDREWPPEIDIMEFVGSKPNEILQTLHWPADSRPQKSDVVIQGDDYSDDWHVYSVDWRSDGIDWYIDGVKTRSYTGSHIPDEPMEIILNLAIGGLLPGNADETTPFPRHLEVDYVRVYQSEDQIRPYQY